VASRPSAPVLGRERRRSLRPRGAYWLGEPTVAQISIDEKHGLERLVAVSPFIVDATETTVKQFRASGIADTVGPGRRQADEMCTYTDNPVNDEKKPVNCLSREQAIAFCMKKGMRLPREGEWEWMASALGRYDKYPWGTDLPGCSDAAFGRNNPPATKPALPPSDSACSPPAGAVDVGVSLRDRVTIDGRTIFDLLGNVSEWLEDSYQDEWESCFTAPIMLDPVCKTPSVNKPRRSLRGSNFLAGVEYVDLKIRESYDDTPDARPHSAGVRCVRDSE